MAELAPKIAADWLPRCDYTEMRRQDSDTAVWVGSMILQLLAKLRVSVAGGVLVVNFSASHVEDN